MMTNWSFNNLGIRYKLLVCLLILIGLMGLMAISALRSFETSRDAIATFSDRDLPRQRAAASLSSQLVQTQGALYRLLSWRSNSNDISKAERIAGDAENDLAELERIATDLQPVESSLRAVNRSDVAAALSAYAKASAQVLKVSQSDVGLAMLLMSQGEAHFDDLQKSLKSVQSNVEQDTGQALERARATSVRASWAFSGLFGAAGLLAIAVTWLTAYSIGGSIRRVTVVMRSLADGRVS